MLERLGHAGAARAIERAVRDALAAGVRTPDIGGTTSTSAAAAAVLERL
jgi:isocitrate/isopropylmalate dehydrogenase